MNGLKIKLVKGPYQIFLKEILKTNPLYSIKKGQSKYKFRTSI